MACGNSSEDAQSESGISTLGALQILFENVFQTYRSG